MITSAKAIICAVTIGLSMSIAAPAQAKAPAPSLLPEPSGALTIGVRTIASASPDATTRVWYPARRGTGHGLAGYLSGEPAAALGVNVAPMQETSTHALVDAAPLADARPRPAVVLMPGWGMPIAWSTALTEELVSNGYVVVTVDPDPGTEDPFAMPTDVADPARRFEQLTAGIRLVLGSTITSVAGPIDRRRIAVGGHSIAGAVAFQASLTDPRIRAVFDLDGWLHGQAIATPVGVPALAIDASGLDSDTLDVIARTNTASTVELEGATHLDVTDLPCLAPALGESVATLGLGTIGCAGTTTANTVVRRFLDEVLKRKPRSPSHDALIDGLPGVRPQP